LLIVRYQRVSSLTVNLVLTLRKALSLAISVTYYGSGFTPGLAIGSAMVLGAFLEKRKHTCADQLNSTAGTALYSVSSAAKPIPKDKTEDAIEEVPRPDEKTFEIIVKRDDAANDPAEKVAPEELLQRMRVHATEVRRRGTRIVDNE
jgi:hypothetical protein